MFIFKSNNTKYSYIEHNFVQPHWKKSRHIPWLMKSLLDWTKKKNSWIGSQNSYFTIAKSFIVNESALI